MLTFKTEILKIHSLFSVHIGIANVVLGHFVSQLIFHCMIYELGYIITFIFRLPASLLAVRLGCARCRAPVACI